MHLNNCRQLKKFCVKCSRNPGVNLLVSQEMPLGITEKSMELDM